MQQRALDANKRGFAAEQQMTQNRAMASAPSATTTRINALRHWRNNSICFQFDTNVS